jgi:hypothetical protein
MRYYRKEGIKVDENKIKELAIISLIAVWDKIDWEKIKLERAYKIWDEFSNKVRAAVFTTNKFNIFINKLCKKLDIAALSDRCLHEIIEMDDEIKSEIVNLLRNDLHSVILAMRLNIEVRKEERAKIKAKESEVKTNEN